MAKENNVKKHKVDCYNTACPENNFNMCGARFCEYYARKTTPTENTDFFNKTNYMLTYDEYVDDEELLDKLISIGCPIKVDTIVEPIIDHIGSGAIAMKLDDEGNPNGVVDTDPTTYKGFEQRKVYSYPTFDEVIRWFELKYELVIGYLYDAHHKKWYDLVWGDYNLDATEHSKKWNNKIEALTCGINKALEIVKVNGL